MLSILTDKKTLREPSKPVDPTNCDQTIQELIDSIPAHGAGLAAPQLGIHERIFLARLTCGSFVLVNPEFVYKSPTTSDSTEGCLSLPDVQCCIERHTHIKMRADKVVRLKQNDGKLLIDQEIDDIFELWGADAYIVQHEYDHLDGILIIDRTQIVSRVKKIEERNRKRQLKIDARRRAKRAKTSPSNFKIGAKKPKLSKEIRKEKKQRYKERKQQRKCMEIRARYEFRQSMANVKSGPQSDDQDGTKTEGNKN